MYLKKTFLFLIASAGYCLFPVLVKSAGPVTHAYLAYQWLYQCKVYRASFTAAHKKRDFLLGTLFPDIRYLAGLPRQSTHALDVSLNRILHTKNPWRAGNEFHAWVDDVREQFMTPARKKAVYAELVAIPEQHRSTYLKFLEDEIIFSLRCWNKMLAYFKVAHSINQNKLAISNATIHTWYRLLQEHFIRPTSAVFKQLSEKNMPYGLLSAAMVKLWAKMMPQHAQNPLIKEHVKQLITHFKEKFLDCHSQKTYPWVDILTD